jgi:sulfur carrier protein
VATALASLDLPPRGIAVALDREVVPRGQWESTTLGDGARLEVVHAVQGG